MFGNSEELQGKLYTKAIKDIDDMVAKYKKTGFSSAELAFYSRLYKRKLFTHYYSRVKHLA
ncbi:hypothetical protein [Streptococcus sanguinis]|jgi:hypothetical protein|uniref:hypothetical protein n=1 Tax=Streptococcus sanguinis TaxID=1305 RepID=UPI0013749A12|nr:hypothetical protein [Streptococcus sanguinis]KAF1306595.1 hypothetical protein I925_10087 [Streptococcus sanguinis OH0843]